MKKSKKSYKKWYILGVIILFLFILAFFVNLRFSFIVSDELIVTQPTLLTAEVQTTQNAQFELPIQIQTSRYCTVVCVATYQDTEIEFALKNAQKYRLNYTLATPQYGFGTLLEPVVLSCTARREGLCFSSQIPRVSQTTLAIAYKQANHEELAVFKASLDQFQTKINEELANQIYAENLLQNLNRSLAGNFNLLYQTLQQTNETLQKVRIEIQEAHNAYLLDEIRNLPNLNTTADIAFVINRLTQAMNERNEAVIELQNITNTILAYYQPYLNTSFERLPSQTQQGLILLQNAVSQNRFLDGSIAYATQTLLEANLTQLSQEILNQTNFVRFQLNLTPVQTATCADASSYFLFAETLNNLAENQTVQLYDAVVESYLANERNETLLLEAPLFVDELKTYCLSESSFTELFTYKNLTQIIVPQPTPLMTTLADTQSYCCSPSYCGACTTQSKTPILFIHGHSFNEREDPKSSLFGFSRIQNELSPEFYNAGVLDVTNTNKLYSQFDFTPTFRATYYYISYYSLGSYSISVQKQDRIENYAIRLKEIIESVKRQTNTNQVTIVAHSMGGLVAREYIGLFGNQSVAKLITINTPHAGVEGSVAKYCGWIGSQTSCDDLRAGSVFLQRLNARPLTVPTIAIRSIGCDTSGKDGDGIVTNESGYLAGATNIVINGTCTDSFGTSLHNNVLSPQLFPEVVQIIREKS